MTRGQFDLITGEIERRRKPGLGGPRIHALSVHRVLGQRARRSSVVLADCLNHGSAVVINPGVCPLAVLAINQINGAQRGAAAIRGGRGDERRGLAAESTRWWHCTGSSVA